MGHVNVNYWHVKPGPPPTTSQHYKTLDNSVITCRVASMNHPPLPTTSAQCARCAGTGRAIDHTALGRQMRTRRERAGLSQCQVAKMLRLHQSFISYLERGVRSWTSQLVDDYMATCQKGGGQ